MSGPGAAVTINLIKSALMLVTLLLIVRLSVPTTRFKSIPRHIFLLYSLYVAIVALAATLLFFLQGSPVRLIFASFFWLSVILLLWKAVRAT